LPDDEKNAGINDVNHVRLPLSRRTLLLTLALFAGLNLLFVLLSVLPRTDALGSIFSLVHGHANLANENNAAAWYSSMTFAAASLAMLLCFGLERNRGRTIDDSPFRTIGQYGWLAMCLAFALLSLDELGSFHERLSKVPIARELPELSGAASSWVGRLAIPIGFVAVAILWFAWSYLRAAPAAMIAALLGLGFLLSVPIQEHLEMGIESQANLGESYVRPRLFLALEEGAELFGALCFIAAPLLFARKISSVASPPVAMVTISPIGFGALGFLLGTGLTATLLLLPEVREAAAADGRGIPQNWFPSLLALWCGALCLLTAKANGLELPRERVGRWLLFGLALIHLALSVDHGANHRIFTARLFTPADWAASIATTILASIGLLVGAAVLVFRSLALRASLLVWLFLLWIGLPAPDPVRSVLPFIAYLTLSLGLIVSLPDRKLCLDFAPQRGEANSRPHP